MTGAYMANMDKIFIPVLGWNRAIIHSRRRGFATAAARNEIHMGYVTIVMRHSKGVTMQHIAFSLAEKGTITTRLASLRITVDKNTTKASGLRHSGFTSGCYCFILGSTFLSLRGEGAVVFNVTVFSQLWGFSQFGRV